MVKASLKTQLIVLCAALVLIPMGIVGVVTVLRFQSFGESSVTKSREALVEQAEQTLAAGAQQTLERVSNVIHIATQQTGAFAASGNMKSYIEARAGKNQVLNDIAMRELERIVQAAALACEAQATYLGETAEGAAAAAQTNYASDFASIVIGKTGYPFVIDSTGKTLVHPNETMVGSNLITDHGLTMFREATTNRKENEVGWVNYDFQGRAKVVAYTYFRPWDWIICASAYWDELSETAAEASFAFLRQDVVNIGENVEVEIDGKDSPLFCGIQLVDEEGTPLLTYRDGKLEESASSQASADWFKEASAASAGTVANSGCYLESVSGDPEMRLATPVFVGGEFAGAVALNVPWATISDTIGNLTFGKTGYAYITDDEGVLISHPDYGLKDNVNTTSSTFGELADLTRDHMLKGEKDVAQYVYEGEPKFAAYTPITVDGLDYVAAATCPADEFLASANELEAETISVLSQTRMMLTVGGIGLAVIGVLIGLYFSTKLSRKLSMVIRELSTASEQVDDAAGQISQSSQSVAEGASEQASSLEETSASLEEISAMTRQNADNANEANTMANEARGAAEKGQEAMSRMSSAIDEIKNSSDETAKIIKTIDEVAFQTNLLALNAAVEAARAGEAGKGFAVVAEEVRNLAQRSAEAAKNTAALIEQSQNHATNGVNVNAEVADALQQIAEKVLKVTQLVEEVSVGSKEQAQGVEQVNTAVSQMNQVTQSNAANSEEAAAASEELSAQSNQLNMMVQELRAIVGGASNSHAPNRHMAVAAPKPKLSQSAPRQKAAPGERRLSLKPALKKAEGQLANPEQVIPLDDEDLSEF